MISARRNRTTSTLPLPFAGAVLVREPTQAQQDARAVVQQDALRTQARDLAESVPPKLRKTYAQAFCAEALAKCWAAMPFTARVAMRRFHAKREPLGKEALATAARLGEAAGSLPLDDASYQIGRTYAVMLPEDYRSENGIFYTPPRVAQRLLDSVTAAGIDWRNCKALDPACGGGAFLGPMARRMVSSMRGADSRLVIKSIQARLSGFELDEFAAWISAVFLDATLCAELGRSTDPEFEPVSVGDSLARPFSGEFDLVIGNPPYGRVALSTDTRKRYSRSLYGHANLYGLFLDLALHLTSGRGIVAYVTPTSFLCGEYFKNLRSVLSREARPVSLDFISEREGVFDDVLQETLLTVFARGNSKPSAQVTFFDTAGSATTVSDGGTVALPAAPEKPWIVPRSPAMVEFAERLRSMSSRLEDWGYKVSTGPLVWNRFKDQLKDKPSTRTVPLIWAESVGTNGSFSFRAARRNHAPYFEVRADDNWLLVKQPCVLVQRTTAKEQPRRLIAAPLPKSFIDEHDAVTVENHLNMVLPCVEKPTVETGTLAAFLNSVAADRAFRCISGTVAVSAYELESMPIPSAWAMRELTALLEKNPTAADIDAFCLRLYGER